VEPSVFLCLHDTSDLDREGLPLQSLKLAVVVHIQRGHETIQVHLLRSICLFHMCACCSSLENIAWYR
jgi:hypothetical protein